jgi:hypothetical protein
MKQSIEKIPTWAFGYIFNGDMTGLTDEEVRMIDESLTRIGAGLSAPNLMKKRNPISHDTLFSVCPPKSRTV